MPEFYLGGGGEVLVVLVLVDGVGSLVFVLGGGWSRFRSRSRRGSEVVVVGGGGAVSVRK
jgi:hypothetical protein